MQYFLWFIIIVVIITDVHHTQGNTCPDLQYDSHMISPFNLTGYQNNDTVIFRCIVGYQLVGRTKLTCAAGGWDGIQPTCKAVPCPDLRSTTHMKQPSKLTGYDYSDSVSFKCIEGYSLVGNDTMECQSTGQWTGQQPSCTAVPCPDLRSTTPMKQPSKLTGYGYSDFVSFKCMEGYSLVGNDTMECQSTGQWTGQQPSCTGIPCPDLRHVTNMKQPSNLTRYRYPDSVSFRCKVGYNILGNTTLKCLSTGQWNGQQPTCAVVSCPNLVTKPHQREPTKLTGYQYSDYVNFLCDSGYKLEGRASIACEASGHWNSPQPSCKAIPCPDLKYITNMKHPSNLTEYQYPDSVSFICADGYNLMGNATLKCQTTGQWNGQQPSCAAVPCPDLKPSSNMLRPASLTGYFYSSTVDFICEYGYERHGPKTLTCASTGQWNDTQPNCTHVPCPRLSTIQYTLQPKRLTGYHYNDTVTYICDTGYALSGSSVITCLANGSWNTREPTCVVCENGYFGENCTYQCHCAVEGCDAMNGHCTNITEGCQPGWSGSNCSVSIICFFEDHVGSLMANPRRALYSEGDNVTFYCSSGYTGTTVISLCIKQNIWSPPLPVCTQTISQDHDGIPYWIYGLTVALIVVLAVVISVVIFRCRQRIKSKPNENTERQKEADDNVYHETTAQAYEEIELPSKNKTIHEGGVKKTKQNTIYENVEGGAKKTKKNKIYENIEGGAKTTKNTKKSKNQKKDADLSYLKHSTPSGHKTK